jgi:transposase
MAALPLLPSQSEGLHPPIRPQPQRPPPPRQPKPAAAGPAELVTCDQTIERAIARLKQHRAIAARYDKLAVSYHTWLVLAALLLWLPA